VARQVPVTARDLATNIGARDLEELRPWLPELAMAVAELARSAGTDWPWGHDDALISLLRAVAKLSIDAPGASSMAAARLLALLAPAGATEPRRCR
jgi:hypothetical protein